MKNQLRKILPMAVALAALSAGNSGCGTSPTQFLADLLGGFSDGAGDLSDALDDLDEDLEDADDGDDIDDAFEDFFDALFGG